MATGSAGSVFGENSFYRETWGTRLGGRQVAERKSDPPDSLPELKVQVLDLVRVVGIIAPFCPTRHGYPGKFVLSRPRGKMGPGDVCRVPPAAVRHGRARQNSGTGPFGDF